MNKAHIIVDFMPLYYKYFFKVKSGKLPKLKYNIDGSDFDTTYLYYITREIEEISKCIGLDRDGVTISICFDSKKSKKKEENVDYKSTRTSQLSEEDINNIYNIYDIYSYWYDAYRVDGYEADDLIVKLANNSIQDKVYVVSPDKDLLHLVNSKVNCLVINSITSKKSLVTIDNFNSFTKEKFKVEIPYNSILLYLCTVGDTSDNIKGIKGFGNSSFNKLIESSKNVDITKLNNKECLIAFLKLKFNGRELEESLKSLEMVYPLDVDLKIAFNNCSKENRNTLFDMYGFKSLIS